MKTFCAKIVSVSWFGKTVTTTAFTEYQEEHHRNGNGSQALRKGGEAKRVMLLLVIIIIPIQRERQCRERYRRSGRGVRYDKRSTINNDSENDKEVWAGDNGGWQGNRKKYVFYKSQCNEDAGVSVGGGGGAVLKE